MKKFISSERVKFTLMKCETCVNYTLCDSYLKGITCRNYKEPIFPIAEWLLERKIDSNVADYKCSRCGYDDTFNINVLLSFYKHCPNCGSIMTNCRAEE